MLSLPDCVSVGAEGNWRAAMIHISGDLLSVGNGGFPSPGDQPLMAFKQSGGGVKTAPHNWDAFGDDHRQPKDS